MPSGYYFATKAAIQSYMDERRNQMEQWWFVESDEPGLQIILCHFRTYEDLNRWEAWPGIEKLERPPRSGAPQKLAAHHVNRLSKKFGVTSDDDAWAVSAKLQAKVGKMMRLPDV